MDKFLSFRLIIIALMLASLGLKSALQKLFELCSNNAFLAGLASGSREEVDNYFKEFYDTYPIYAIEWVDSKDNYFPAITSA